MLWLTRKTKTTFVAIVSLFVCVVLAVFGARVFVVLQNETLDHGATGLAILVNRSTLSPAWYRIAFPMLYFIPLFSWASHTYRHQIKSKHYR
jgi:uncharacterized membrane-anchored protein YitT (DUF2179 family)